MEKSVGCFSSGPSEEVRVEFRQHQNRRFLDIRLYASVPDLNEKVPTGKGVLIPVACLPDLKKAVIEAEKTWSEPS